MAIYLQGNKSGTPSHTMFQMDQSENQKHKNYKVFIKKLEDSMYLEISGWVAI